MVPAGRCLKSCGKCGTLDANSGCSDVPPEGPYSCTQQVRWGKCQEQFIVPAGRCLKSCAQC